MAQSVLRVVLEELSRFVTLDLMKQMAEDHGLAPRRSFDAQIDELCQGLNDDVSLLVSPRTRRFGRDDWNDFLEVHLDLPRRKSYDDIVADLSAYSEAYIDALARQASAYEDSASATPHRGRMTLDDVMRLIREEDDAGLRLHLFEIGGEGPDPGSPYDYQLHGISRIESGEGASPPVSGILHYPTGAGKTRVGMELIARTLRRDPTHRFVWATDRKALLRQSMRQMAELARLFPPGTTFTWAQDASEVKDGEHDVNVVFMTRRSLTEALAQASDGRSSHHWKDVLARREAITLVYDECHQLGADQLQRNWRRFHDAVVSSGTRWRTIGLSATPVPTAPESHALLGKYVFPQRPQDAPLTAHDYPFHFFHRVKIGALIASGVLCPINLKLDQSGTFDFPELLLEQVIGARLRPPGPKAAKWELAQYAKNFNKTVLSDPRILEFLADRLGESLGMLGKTVVFVPTIQAANHLVSLLHERFPALRGRVAAVHSKMSELDIEGQEGETVHHVLDKFRARKGDPSILVNVEMLTEGFDDPQIRTVVLARLTLSTNRFWQMIGRGTRGVAAKGTKDCYVIDPVKLVRLYDYFAGYQPQIGGGPPREFEDPEDEERGDAANSPEIPTVSLPPDPGVCRYEVDPELLRVNQNVASALRDFLAAESLAEDELLQIARAADVAFVGGAPTLVPNSRPFAPDTAAALLLREVSVLEARSGRDLTWFRRRLPESIDEPLLRRHTRALRAIEALSLWTESDLAAAELSGAFQRRLQTEAQAVGAKANPTASSVETRGTPTAVVFAPMEALVLDALLALAALDGPVRTDEVKIVAESLRQMFGRAPTDDVLRAIGARPPPVLAAAGLGAQLPALAKQHLLVHLAEVAACDGAVSPEERAHILAVSRGFGMPDSFVDAMLGSASGAFAKAPTRTCASCSFPVPDGAAFCSSCGVGV